VEVLQRKTNLMIGQRQKPMRHDVGLEAPCPGTGGQQGPADVARSSGHVREGGITAGKERKYGGAGRGSAIPPCAVPTPRLPCHHNNDVIIGPD
jgi:hypothetical protein